MQKLSFSAILSIVFGLLSIGAGVFAVIEFMEFSRYSNRADEIIAEAADTATTDQKLADQALFFEAAKGTPDLAGVKNPLKYAHFKSPTQFATIEFDYPQTWSSYEKNDASKTTDAKRYDVYFDVTGSQGVRSTLYSQQHSLQISIVSQSYEDTLAQYRKNIDKGVLSASPYIVPGHDGQASYTGVRLDGQLEEGVSGVLVVVKTREKSLLIRSDVAETMTDFEKIVLPSFTFVP